MTSTNNNVRKAMYLRENSRIQFTESKIVLGIIGVLSGVICGLFGVGALLAAYVGRVAVHVDRPVFGNETQHRAPFILWEYGQGVF